MNGKPEAIVANAIHLPSTDDGADNSLHCAAGKFPNEIRDCPMSLVERVDSARAAPVTWILEACALLASSLAISVRLGVGVRHAKGKIVRSALVELDL